jgi:gas vesicle protein
MENNEREIQIYKSESNANGIIIALFSGIVIGGVLGILFAPKSGKETRKEIVDKGTELYEKSKDNIEAMVEKSKEFVDKSKDKIDEAMKTVTTKVEDAKQKIDDVVSEVKTKAKKTEDKLS